MRGALLLASGFAAFSLLHLARVYDGSAMTYVIVAEQGLRKVHQAAHPLYVPLLRAAAALGAPLGLGPPFLTLFQLLSLAAAAAALALLYATAAELSGDPRAALWAALLFFLQRGPWHFSMQAKPYAAALAAAALALRLLLARGPGRFRGGLAAGAAVGAATALDAFLLALAPLALLGRRGRSWARGYALALGACLLACYWALPSGLRDTSADMQGAVRASLVGGTPPGRVLGSLAGGLGDAWWLLPWGPALWAALRAREGGARRAAAHAGAFVAGAAALFALFDAENPFLFVLGLPLVPLLAALARGDRSRRAVLAASAAAVGLHTYLAVVRPAAAGEDPSRAEVEFLDRSLGAEDVLLVAGAPDWRIAYFGAGRVRFVRLDGGFAGGPYDPPRAVILPGVLDAVDAELRRGRRVWLAADSRYRPDDVLGDEAVRRYQEEAQALLAARFRFGSPRISPGGEWYFPLQALGRVSAAGRGPALRGGNPAGPS